MNKNNDNDDLPTFQGSDTPKSPNNKTVVADPKAMTTGQALFMVVFVIPIIAMNAMIFCIMWQWFLVEPWHVPQLTFWHAMGMTAFAQFLAQMVLPLPRGELGNIFKSYMSMNVVGPLLLFATGMLAHHFM